MKTRQEAKEIAQRHLAAISAQTGTDLVLVPEETVEFDLGWIFFWDSKRYLETHDSSEALAGNAPIIVDRRDGSVHQASTALGTPEKLIQWYHRQQESTRAK